MLAPYATKSPGWYVVAALYTPSGLMPSTNLSQIAYYDEIRYAKSCKKLKIKDLGYSCEEIESQN